MTFKADIEADLEVFLDPEEFGTEAVFQHGAGTPKTINVLFDNAYEREDISGEGIGTTFPVARVHDADIAEASRNDTLQIGSVVYYIGTVKPDGTGMSIIELSEDEWD